eukprot:5512491-Prorocentrum_lima.AAC.1
MVATWFADPVQAQQVYLRSNKVQDLSHTLRPAVPINYIHVFKTVATPLLLLPGRGALWTLNPA